MVISSKAKKTQPYTMLIKALVFLAASLFLIQLLANKMLTREESISPVRSREMSVLPFAGPSLASDLLNDEFFSSPFMFDSGLLEIKKEMDRQRELMFKSMSSPTLTLDKCLNPHTM